MAKASAIQNNFVGGELSPLLDGRPEAPLYKAGMATLENMIPLQQGPLTFRPGTHFAAEAKTSAKATRLVRFEFSATDAFIIEFGEYYCRFFTNRAAYLDSGTPVEIITPYAESELFELHFEQQADTIYITHPNHRTRRLRRAATYVWTLDWYMHDDGPYDVQNASDITLTPAAASSWAFTERANPKNYSLWDVTYAISLGLFIAVGQADGGDAYIITSPDGITWTERANAANRNLYAVGWDETNTLATAVGAGGGGNSYILTSPDGVTWTQRTNTAIYNESLSDVIWCDSLSLWVAVGGRYDGGIGLTRSAIFTSPDGITWTQRSVVGGDLVAHWLYGVAFDGTTIVAVGGEYSGSAFGQNTTSIVTSTDGITWNVVYAKSGTYPSHTYNILRNVYWTGQEFVAVGQYDDHYAALVYRSEDGTNWSRHTPDVKGNLYGVHVDRGLIVAVGGDTSSPGFVATSLTGEGWRYWSTPKNFPLRGVATNGTITVCVGEADGTDAYIVTAPGPQKITASFRTFQSTDIGRQIRHWLTDTWGWAEICQYNSEWEVYASIESSFKSATASTDWRLGIWSPRTGFPRTATFFQDRLSFAGGLDALPRVDFSKSGDYPNFAPTGIDGTVSDASAIGVSITGSDVQDVSWLASQEKALLVGTPGGVTRLGPATESAAMSPTNIAARPFSVYGSSTIEPVKAGRSTVYSQRGGRALRAVGYDLLVDGFSTDDLSLGAQHIAEIGLGQMAYQTYPNGQMWVVGADGTLVGITYSHPNSKDQPVPGWQRHILGGAFGGSTAVVESVAVIPSPDGTSEDVWLVVKRTIDGATVRYIEWMKAPYEDGSVLEDKYFVDCGTTYTGASTTTISGLDYLEGQVVKIVIGGATHPDKTVTSGAVTLDYASGGDKVHVGLGYVARGKHLRFDAGAQDGTSVGKTQRAHRVNFDLFETVNLKIGRSFDELYAMPFRDSTMPAGDPITPFTGIKSWNWPGGYSMDERICWQHDDPLPFTLRAVAPQINTQDRG
jgi:hypothetical protein